MSIYTLYGINGVGKDTVAGEVKRDFPDTQITSESRILMYLLGITSEFGTDYPVSREQYRQLEDMPQPVMRDLTEGEYKCFVQDLRDRDDVTVILSHLVFALFLDKEIQYLDDKDVPDWFIQSNDALVQLIAPPELVLARRAIDARDRGAANTKDIEYHQYLCDQKWVKVVNLAGVSACHTVENIVLEEAATRFKEVIYG